ncbi:MAG: CBS domain-containing protein [Elusimicrobia bacterium]|nr:CBS domain-containing protein [Elusimicrobiota bacterium]
MPIDWKVLTAKQVMRRRVATLGPDDSLRDAAELFLEEGVSGAPVVDDDGRVLGVISQTDLMRRTCESALGQLPPFYYEGSEIRVARVAPAHDLSPVREAMSREVVSVEEDVPVPDIAGLMAERGIHRVLVTRGGELRGIVSTLDIVRLVADQAERELPKAPPATRRERTAKPARRTARATRRRPPARARRD